MVMDDRYIIPQVFIGQERQEILSLDDAFMSMALLMSKRSKDPNTQVGAIIVGTDNRVLTMGYNGTPKGWKDYEFPWGKDYAEIAKKYEKYGYVVHAEQNSLANYKGSKEDLEGATAYVTLFPCQNCAKLLVQYGIKRVVYYSDKYNGLDDNRIAKTIFEYCNVEYVQYKSNELSDIVLHLDEEKDVDMIKKEEKGRKRKK